MKNILHINPQLDSIGGMERYIEQYYECFDSEYNIYLLKFYNGVNNINIEKNYIFSLNHKKHKTNIYLKIKNLFKISYKIKKICKQKYINFSISHGDYANLFNIFSKFLGNRSKIIIIFHNSFDKKLAGYILYYLFKIFYKYADNIISVSDELTKDLQIIFKNKEITTIYNPINIVDINIKKHLKNNHIFNKIILNGKEKFCTISRLDTNKNQKFLIECFYEYCKIKPDSQLFIIGDGENKYFLEKIITKYKLNEKVFLLGEKNNVFKYLNKMDYFIFSSLKEGFGRSLIESLSCGIPVLTHDYKYGAKEIIRNNKNYSKCIDIEIHKNGILTPYLDKETFIEGMKIISTKKWDKMKLQNNCKKYSIKKFKNNWNLLLKKNNV